MDPNYVPDTPITGTVYWTATGKKYHLYRDCRSLKNANSVYSGTVEQAYHDGCTGLCAICAGR